MTFDVLQTYIQKRKKFDNNRPISLLDIGQHFITELIHHTFPDILKIGTVPAVPIADRFAKLVEVPIK